MRILGIETSCDETACAVVENGAKIISNIVASSASLQAKFGGIIPEQAAREQVRSIIPVINEALITANSEVKSKNLKLRAKTQNFKIGVLQGELQEWAKKNIDAVAVTVGPGLTGSLLVGIETARVLSYVWEKPIIPVNHLVGHIYANFIDCSNLKLQNSELEVEKQEFKTPQLPALALVVSGGHTDLVLMKAHGDINWIGGTRDDAAGEAFDKTARLLGLNYPGGPAIAAEAAKFQARRTKSEKLNLFPRPMMNDNNYDWSFSGLKTAVLRTVQSNEFEKHGIEELAAQIQEAIVDSLVVKSMKAIGEFKPKSFLLAGGVAANKRLVEKFESRISELEDLNVKFFVPAASLCTDNAAYIAAEAYYNFHPVSWQKILPNADLSITDIGRKWAE
jgi:N6-L-threonylcarbamoyladenine synthase